MLFRSNSVQWKHPVRADDQERRESEPEPGQCRIPPIAESHACEFKERDRRTNHDEQRQTPGRQIADDGVDDGNADERRVDTPGIKPASRCGNRRNRGCRPVAMHIYWAEIVHVILGGHSAQDPAKPAFTPLVFDQRKQEFTSPKVGPGR